MARGHLCKIYIVLFLHIIKRVLCSFFSKVPYQRMLDYVAGKVRKHISVILIIFHSQNMSDMEQQIIGKK